MPAVLWVANLMKLPSDFFRMTMQRTRIQPTRLAGIGAWLHVFESIVVLSVAVNILVWMVTYNGFVVLFGQKHEPPPPLGNSTIGVLTGTTAAVVNAESALFYVSLCAACVSMHLAIRVAMPAVPNWLVDFKMEAQKKQQAELQRLMNQRQHEGKISIATVNVLRCRNLPAVHGTKPSPFVVIHLKKTCTPPVTTSRRLRTSNPTWVDGTADDSEEGNAAEFVVSSDQDTLRLACPCTGADEA